MPKEYVVSNCHGYSQDFAFRCSLGLQSFLFCFQAFQLCAIHRLFLQAVFNRVEFWNSVEGATNSWLSISKIATPLTNFTGHSMQSSSPACTIRDTPDSRCFDGMGFVAMRILMDNRLSQYPCGLAPFSVYPLGSRSFRSARTAQISKLFHATVGVGGTKK